MGVVIHHRRFGYRGVVIGMDTQFEGSNEWYEAVARSRPPKDRPWYHILPHGASHQTYVAERNLEADTTGQPVQHPGVEEYFTHFIGGRYVNGYSN